MSELLLVKNCTFCGRPVLINTEEKTARSVQCAHSQLYDYYVDEFFFDTGYPESDEEEFIPHDYLWSESIPTGTSTGATSTTTSTTSTPTMTSIQSFINFMNSQTEDTNE